MRGRLPLFALAGVALLYAVLIVSQPAPMDWRPDYEGQSSRALGADVLRAMLPAALAPSGSIGAQATAVVRDVSAPPFMHLAEPRGDTTYVFLTQSFEPDEAETRRILAHARAGATVFVAAQQFGGPLFMALGSREPAKADRREVLQTAWRGLAGTPADSALQLTAASLRRPAGYRFPFPVSEWVLTGLDSTTTDVLARGRDGEPVVARVRHGRGAFVLSSAPDAFSNAALMGADGRPTDAPAFVAGVLAYLRVGPAFWDEYLKPRRGAGGTPLRYILGRPPLRFAYLLTLLGVLSYIVFRGRRWQRPIPVVEPPPNAAVEFVRTLGRLHFQHGDHRALVDRRARYAMDRLRTRLGVADADLSPATEARLVRRGLPQDFVSDAFGRMRVSANERVDPNDVVALDRALEALWHEAEKV